MPLPACCAHTLPSSRQNTAVSPLHATTSTLCSHSAFKQTKHSCQSTSHNYQHAVLTLCLQADKTQLSVHFTQLPARCAHTQPSSRQNTAVSPLHTTTSMCLRPHSPLHRHVNPPTKHICTLSSLRSSSEFFFQHVPVLHSLQQEARDLVVLSSAAKVRVALTNSNTTAIVTMQQTTTHSTPQATQHTACTQHALVSSIYITLGVEVEIFSSKSTFQLPQLQSFYGFIQDVNNKIP